MPNYQEHKLYNGDVTIKFDEANHAYWTEGEELKKDGTPKMKRLAGVTTYCGIVDKSKALIPWAVNTTIEFIREHIDLLQTATGDELLELARQEADKQRDLAAEIGSAIHLWIEQHIKGEQPEMPDDEKILNGVNSFLEWVNKNNVTFLWSEKIVYSKEYGYVGKADIGAEIDGKKYLLDIKTGNGIYEEVKMQTAAYLMALYEETQEQYAGRYVIRISKETEDEYKERMKKKNDKRKDPIALNYQLFEVVFLDDDDEVLSKDFKGFLNAMELYRWKSQAFSELMELRK